MLHFIEALPVAPTQPNKEAIQCFFMRPPAKSDELIYRLKRQYAFLEIVEAVMVLEFLYPDHYNYLIDRHRICKSR
jgi:hypothetical protein